MGTRGNGRQRFVKDKDGRMLQTSEETLERWTEYCRELYKETGDRDPTVIAELEQIALLEDEGNGSVKFIHGENFGGIMIPFMNKMLDKTEVGFRLMNEAIKKRCEE